MATVNFNTKSNGFIDCISALNWQVGGAGNQRVAFGKVYQYSLSVWKNAYNELCDKHGRHATYQEYIDWMNEVCLLPDVTAEDSLARYAEVSKQREEEKRAEHHLAELLRTHYGVFLNACDDLYYGYGFKKFYPAYSGDLSEADAKIIWDAAFEKMAHMD